MRRPWAGEQVSLGGEQVHVEGAQLQASAQGREVRFGIRLHVITRDTADAAWAQAEELLRGIPAEMIEQVQAGLSKSESVGRQRMRSLFAAGYVFLAAVVSTVAALKARPHEHL